MDKSQVGSITMKFDKVQFNVAGCLNHEWETNNELEKKRRDWPMETDWIEGCKFQQETVVETWLPQRDAITCLLEAETSKRQLQTFNAMNRKSFNNLATHKSKNSCANKTHLDAAIRGWEKWRMNTCDASIWCARLVHFDDVVWCLWRRLLLKKFRRAQKSSDHLSDETSKSNIFLHWIKSKHVHKLTISYRCVKPHLWIACFGSVWVSIAGKMGIWNLWKNIPFWWHRSPFRFFETFSSDWCMSYLLIFLVSQQVPFLRFAIDNQSLSSQTHLSDMIPLQ
jgi:hypothetical protein